MRFILLCAICFLASCTDSDTNNQNNSIAPDPWFEDVAIEWGVDFTYNNGAEGDFHIAEVTGGAPALFDFDNDGDLDLYIVQGKGVGGNALYENVDGTFVDRTIGSGTNNKEYGIGVTTGDYDQDGDTDLYVTNLGVNCLLRNDGAGKFTDVTSFAGVEDDGFSACSAFGDLDGDGDLDLVVTRYLDLSFVNDRVCLDVMSQRTYCNPVVYEAEIRDTFFFNNGDGTFTDVSKEAGIIDVKGTGLGVFIADLTGDSIPDVFIANDGMPDRLWVNQGDGTFVEEAIHRNIGMDDSGKAKAGMGVTPVDFDLDGDFDVFVTNVYGESDSFYRNEGDYFQDVTRRSGLSAETRAYTRWGLVFRDFNNDSKLDLYETTGSVATGANLFIEEDPLAEPNLLFEQVDNNRFHLVHPIGGTSDVIIRNSHGVASGDIDGDGGIDLVIVNSNAPVNILKNVVKNRGNWISFQILNQNKSDAIGAIIEVEFDDGSTHFSQVMTAVGYASAHDPKAHFGLGSHSVQSVRIQWPDGNSRTIENPELDKTHIIQYVE